MTEVINKEPSLAQKYKSLISIPSIGRVVAATLICYLSELGSLKAKQIAKLAGLAPINCDSGKKQGKRSIQGGRMQVRRALYGDHSKPGANGSLFYDTDFFISDIY